MDIKIEKKRGWRGLLRKKNLPYAAGVIFLVFVLWLVFKDHSSTLRVDARTINIVKVERGEFNDYVRVTGQVQPITTVQLSPLEGGIVEKIVVEEGTQVKKGEVIVVLSNNNLNLQILESEAQLAEKQNFLRNTLISMEQEKLSLRQDKLQLDLDVDRKKRTYQQNTELYKNKLVAREIWLQSKEDYELASKKRVLNVERQKQDSLYRNVQVQQMQESLDNMKRNMMLIRERVANLHIKSPIDGELGLLEVVLGQSGSMGQKIGQINDLNGQFKADFVFTGERPDNIRTGQTYYLNLQLGQPEEAVIIPRGSFYQITGGAWIYVVDKNGDRAYKRNIKIGRQNPQYYEVVEGLEPGEKVIVSGYENYGKNDVLILKR